MYLYLSFLHKSEFLGAMWVHQAADDILNAPVWVVKRFPDKPPTEMAVVLMPNELVPADHKWHGRLLTKEELDEATGGQAMRYGDLKEVARLERN